MISWNPTLDQIEEWEPKGGWNAVFSEKDKIQMTNLFFFLKNKKGWKDDKAQIIAQMIVWKQKYEGLMYSEEQERIIRDGLQTIFSS